MTSSTMDDDFEVVEVSPDVKIVGHILRKEEDEFAIAEKKLFPENQVIFYTDLDLSVKCSNCSVRHRKYGYNRECNSVVVFAKHDCDSFVYYQPYFNKANMPFRMPKNNDILINGVRWNTLSREGYGNKRKPGIKNSCMIDSFLTDVKLRTLDPGFCFECRFQHRNGDGRLLERTLRTLIFHLLVYAKPEKDGEFMAIKKFTTEEDLKIKRIWLNKNGFRLHSVFDGNGWNEDLTYYEFADGRQELGEAFGGWHKGVNASMDLYILRRIDTVSAFMVLAKCRCSEQVQVRMSYGGIIRKVPGSSQRLQWTFSLAYRNFNSEAREFEDNFWLWHVYNGESIVTTFDKVEPARPVNEERCSVCIDRMVGEGIQIPTSTWMLVVEFALGLRRTPLSKLRGFEQLTVQQICFELAFVSLLQDNGHFVSIHYFNGKWFFYDDLQGGKMTRISSPDAKYDTKVNLRAFYYRKTPTNPHACLVRIH